METQKNTIFPLGRWEILKQIHRINYMKKIVLLILCLILLSGAGSALADGKNWRNDSAAKLRYRKAQSYDNDYRRVNPYGGLGYNFNTSNNFMWWYLINGYVMPPGSSNILPQPRFTGITDELFYNSFNPYGYYGSGAYFPY